MYDRILVAVDDSPERAHVLEHAAGLALATGAAVHVLHIQTIETDAMATGVVEEDTGQVHALVTASIKELTTRGVTADGEIREAIRPDIAAAVLKAAADQRADLIMLGVRRHSGLTGLILGSVADGVAHGTPPCPVLLVP
ncbi:universal stress protein [Actinomadura scrupuli]|uniref:universal stress protein n=1 Tax=Actinomadura scrupuli TaxID=559629 RepID=UPI003D96F5D8